MVRAPVAVEDTRPIGSLLNADPSGAAFARSIHTFDEPRGNDEDPVGPTHGIRTVTANELRYYDPQWNKRHPREDD
jgi:hypothetical protein